MKIKPWIGLCRSVVWPRVVGVVATSIGTILAAFQEGSDE